VRANAEIFLLASWDTSLTFRMRSQHKPIGSDPAPESFRIQTPIVGDVNVAARVHKDIFSPVDRRFMGAAGGASGRSGGQTSPSRWGNADPDVESAKPCIEISDVDRVPGFCTSADEFLTHIMGPKAPYRETFIGRVLRWPGTETRNKTRLARSLLSISAA
jgi:hypothetical protein